MDEYRQRPTDPPEASPVDSPGGFDELRRSFSPEFAQRVAGIFLKDGARHLETLRRAEAERDGAALREAAHTFKGACGMLGLGEMTALCERLQRLGAEGALDGAGELVTRLEAAFEEARETLGGQP